MPTRAITRSFITDAHPLHDALLMLTLFSHHLCCRIRKSLLGIKYNIAKSHLTTTQLFCLNERDNKIRAAGATTLVEALKETKNLEKLNLYGEFWMVGIARSLTVMTPYLSAWWGCRCLVSLRVTTGYTLNM